jgi:hypothetical protein
MNRLATAALVSLLAFTAACMGEVGPEPGTPDMPAEVSVTSSDEGEPASQCDMTHPRVGATGELTTRNHGVTGTVTVLDDCTLLIEDFHYDGGGLDVKLWSGEGGNFSAGVPLSRNLLRAGGYEAETLTLTLPDEVSLDDFDSISVWCVTVGVSFGDAVLAS